MSKGYLGIVLHAHLPYVRHPEHERSLEERWFFEAMTESYIPLINTFSSLLADGVDFGVTISLSPTLLSMMKDPFLQDRYARHLEQLIELAAREVERTKGHPQLGRLARMYLGMFEGVERTFAEQCKRDVTGALQKLFQSGHVELATTAATHAYLPLVDPDGPGVRAQVRQGIRYFEECFGVRPKGFWLPECGYAEGLERVLADEGIKYFILEHHGLTLGAPYPRAGTFNPVRTPAGVYAFGRDQETAKQVWSATEGYPGDYDYRDFYRDIGFDLDDSYIRPYVHGDLRVHTGIKYHRITGPHDYKELYDPDRAMWRAREHADNFVFNRRHQIRYWSARLPNPPIVVAPYDAELFGHWWFEGPWFLDFVFRKIGAERDTVETTTLSRYLESYPDCEEVEPSGSSWGYKGYNEVWLNGTNDWVYPHLHHAARRMARLVRSHAGGPEHIKRALAQAARELVLAQASDWPFIMHSGTQVGYAHQRFVKHMGRFLRLAGMIETGAIDSAFVDALGAHDNIFPSLDVSIFS